MSKKIHITIDGKTVEVSEGTTVLEAATSLGIDIPTLCYLPGRDPHTSCMLCVVLNSQSGKLFPSCSFKVMDGMVINTQSDAVRKARKTALELLLSDHVGECDAPCQIACPAGINIPKVFSALQQDNWQRAYEVIMEVCDGVSIPCFECKEVCSRVCRRRKYDDPLNIRELMLEVFRKCHVASSLPLEKVKKSISYQYKHRLGKDTADYSKQLFHNCGSLRGLSVEQASLLKRKQEDPVAEATRCLLCGCGVADDCKLRLYADLYGANSKTFEGSKKSTKTMEAIGDGILHEPGKCIQCGICVRLSEGGSNGINMGFYRRGFDMSVEAISNETKSVETIPSASIDHCPTGALVWHDRSRT